MPFDETMHEFICYALSAVNEEVEKLDDQETLLSSTEIVESIFGSYKYHTSIGGHGITGNVLTIGTFTGKPMTTVEICEVMEKTSVRSVLNWVDEKIGDSLAKIRNRFFKKPIKGQNLTDELVEAVACS